MLTNRYLLDRGSRSIQAEFILSLLREAKKASKKHKTHEAIFFYNEILKVDPENEEAWWGKGCEYVYLRHQKKTKQFLGEEIRCYEKILNYGEDAYYFIWFEKASLHQELEQIGEAILCYTRFIELCDEEDHDDLEYGARSWIVQLSEKFVKQAQ